MENFPLTITGVLFWSTVLLAVIHIGKNKIRRNRFIVQGIIGLYILYILRMILPFDFGFGISVSMPESFSLIYGLIVLHTYNIFWIEVSIATIICVIWLSVAIWRIFLLVRRYLAIGKIIDVYKPETTPEIITALKKAERHIGRKINAEIFKSTLFRYPMAFGIFRKRIILPAREYADYELEYIFTHELTHIRHYDLEIKMLIQLLCCMFWWNPLVYFMKKDLNHLLEIRCDSFAAASMNSQEKSLYLNTIIQSMKYAASRENDFNYIMATLVDSTDEKNILERFQLVCENDTVKRKDFLKFAGTMFIGICCFIASYHFFPSPSFKPPAKDLITGNAQPLPEHAFISHRSDGSYYLIINNTSGSPLSQESVIAISETGIKIYEEE